MHGTIPFNDKINDIKSRQERVIQTTNQGENISCLNSINKTNNNSRRFVNSNVL